MNQPGSEAELDSIPAVLSFFGLSPALSAVRINNGMSNHNYAVGTAGDEYVVKFLAGQTEEGVQNDLAIQRQLRRAGVGTPRYLPGLDGTPIYRGQDVIAVISRKIDGVTPTRRSVGLVRDTGRHLALFHTSVRTLPYRNDRELMNPTISGIMSDWARALFSASLPRGIIHGDLHDGNVLTDPSDPERVIAVLDFEEAGENLFLIDLALTVMAVSSATAWDSTFEPGLMHATLQGYESVRPLTEDEHGWLPTAMRYSSEAWITWFARNGYEDYARRHQRRYDSFRAILSTHLEP